MGRSEAGAREQRAQKALDAGEFYEVIAALGGLAESARENSLLGIALMRVGRLAEAEFALLRAGILGDPEGQVEYGNVLRLLGRFAEAVEHLESVSATLSGGSELAWRCQRWWGVAEFQMGFVEDGLRRVERAWHGYIALNVPELTGRVTQSLAAMHLRLGNHARARLLYQEAIRVLPEAPLADARLDALQGLLDIELHAADFDGAHATLRQAKRLLAEAGSPRAHAMIASAEAELHRLTGNLAAYLEVLERLFLVLDEVPDHELRVWTISRLVDALSQHGQIGRAMQVLVSYGTPSEQWPPELLAARGFLNRRRGETIAAQQDLERAAGLFRLAERIPEMTRVLLHAAAAALRNRRPQAAVEHLMQALFDMVRLRQVVAFRPDLEELSELVHHAILEPDLAPLMEPVLTSLAHLAGMPALEEDGAMHLQITSLGRVAVYRDGVEVAFSLSGSVPLLIHLVLHPGLTRAQMQLALYPDKDASTGASYIRSAIVELREKLGREVIAYDGPHNAPTYRLGRLVHVTLDLTAFQEAIRRGELARALALYRGEFLPAVQDSAWVQGQREEAMLALTLELKNQMVRYQEAGDLRRVILIANQYLKTDPYDLEVLQARVEAARVAASATELARYQTQLRQFLMN